MTINLNNGIDTPLIGYGTYGLGEKEIEQALALGYRSIDTAHGYGNEAEVGKAIKNSGLPRDQIFVTTKVTNGVQRENNVQQEFEQSLINLGLDYVDLYLIHWPVKEKFVQTWLEFEEIYAKGKARSIGVSNFQIYHFEELLKVAKVTPVLNQIELHPYLTQEPLIAYCKQHNIVPQAWSPLGAGKANLVEDTTILEVAKNHNKTPAQIILRWDIQQDIVTIPKSANSGRMKSNLEIFDFELTQEEMSAITALNKDMRTGPDPDNFTF
ncbi:MAG: aldo/keto reductase [Defluviitaleaceae bacterium]|nr:aldo/keto reductase [Defluviitaleaceae bacterium]